MKSKLTLTSPILSTTNDRQINAIAAALANSTAELEGDIKTNIQRSVPAGRTYRRTPIVRKGSRRIAGLALRRRTGGAGFIVGYSFHRASAVGQPPAIDSGRLINSIRGIAISRLRYRINVGVAYGLPLDDPEGLDRPFFSSRVDRYRPIFFENIRRAVFGR